MLEGRLLIDAHVHPARLDTVKPAWRAWAEQFGQPGWQSVFDRDGRVIPAALDELMDAEGVDHAILLCEYSPKATAAPDLLLPVLRDFPGLTLVLAHGGRGWWYEAAATLALLHDNVWIELS